MYGAEMPTRAPHTDDSVPSWQRMFYGPNVWPAAEEALPGFRPAVEALGESYLQLHHALVRGPSGVPHTRSLDVCSRWRVGGRQTE